MRLFSFYDIPSYYPRNFSWRIAWTKLELNIKNEISYVTYFAWETTFQEIDFVEFPVEKKMLCIVIWYVIFLNIINYSCCLLCLLYSSSKTSNKLAGFSKKQKSFN